MVTAAEWFLEQLAGAYRAAAYARLQERSASMAPVQQGSSARPAAPVDVDDLRKRLVASATVARTVATQLSDVASIAYETVVGERVGSGGTSEGHAHTSTGDRRAKAALATLDHAVSVFVAALRGVEDVVAGGTVDPTLRGTMLGDGSGQHPADTLAKLLKNQRQRRDRGEFTPARIVDQPKLHDGRRRKGKR